MTATLVVQGFREFVDLDAEANADREPDTTLVLDCEGDIRFTFERTLDIRDDDGALAWSDGVNPGIWVSGIRAAISEEGELPDDAFERVPVLISTPTSVKVQV